MIHIVFGFPDGSAKGEPVLLYAGPSRGAAREALAAGSPGISRADYFCDPIPQQTRRFQAGSPPPEMESAADSPPPPEDGGHEAADSPAAPPLPLPAKSGGKPAREPG